MTIMSPSPYSSSSAENDTFLITPEMLSLSDMMDLDELLPIEQDDFLRSCSSLTDFPQYMSKPQQSVTFGGIQSLDFIESSRDMTDQDIEDRWFTRSQLYDFKRNARTLCKEEHRGKDIGEDESTRGMDVYFPARQKSHSKYIYHVMQAFHVDCKGNPEYVAQLCEKWSAKSRDRAMLAGIQDFYQAYFPHMAHSSKNAVGKVATAPIPRPHKRSASVDMRAPPRTRSL